MFSPIRSAILASFAFAAVAGAQAQSGQPTAPAAPAIPAAGTAAPDFAATATDSTGRAIPVSLSALKGKVVVLAFYPADRSSGCTIELTKFRDEYKTLFGDGVVVFPTSNDSLASHSSWAKEAHFPFAMISDPKAEVATKYGSQGGARPNFRRTVFVIGKDGKIAYSEGRFNANAQDGYDKLGAAIKAAKAQ
jgi:thioredoxin-dependent peroxiredoxin